MEFFQRAKVFRLKCSHQSKYLTADQDEETLRLTRDTASPYARWSYELVEGHTNLIRLRSCKTWKYLAASEEQFLLGMTGKRVAQRSYLGSTVEWEPIKEGPYVKLKSSHFESLLRGNRGPPPWRNTITHDVPGHWTVSESVILWIVDIVEIGVNSIRLNDDDHDASLSSNVLDQRFSSSTAYLSMDDDDDGGGGESAANLSSLEDSDSFTKLNSMLHNLDGTLHDPGKGGGTTTITTEHNLPSQVKMAKKTLTELTHMDFQAIITSGRSGELESALILLADEAKNSRQAATISNNDLLNLNEQLKFMKRHHEFATEELSECGEFDNLISKMKAEVDKDVAKACVLEATLETLFGEKYVNGGVEREELMKELEATESSIKAVEVLKNRIEKKTRRLEEMEGKEVAWQERKVEAERVLDRVEDEWVKVKSLFTKVLFI